MCTQCVLLSNSQRNTEGGRWWGAGGSVVGNAPESAVFNMGFENNNSAQ